MPCIVCGDERACLACLGEGRLRWLVDNDPAYRAEIARRWRAAPGDVDPIALAIDLCEFRASCSCRTPIRCLQAGEPALVGLDDCRACRAADATA